MALATQAEAHLEWHRNSGVPVGFPCPWDACDPEDLDPADRRRLARQRDVNMAHIDRGEVGDTVIRCAGCGEVHLSVANVHACQIGQDLPDVYVPSLCEHGMSADLCAGPGHYPDEREDY